MSPQGRVANSVSSKSDLVIADALGTQLTQLSRVLHRARTRWSKAYSVGPDQSTFAILATLVVDGPQRTSALAEALHTEISTISRQTSVLVQHGLIQRLADPKDGRACVLAPTADGRHVFDGARRARNLWLAKTMQSWRVRDVEQLSALLERLNTDLLADEVNV